MTPERRWLVPLAALVAIICLAMGLAACGSSDGSGDGAGGTTPAETSTGGPENAADVSESNLKFIMVGGSPPSIPTAAHIINGLKAADAVYGSTTEYRGPPSLTFDANEARRLFENALAEKPDGIIANDFEPATLNPVIEEMTQSGTPVVLANSGLSEVEKVGALTYVGNDEYSTGKKGGEMLGEGGAENALLVTGQPGLPLVDERNEGFEEGFPGEVTLAALPLAELGDTTKVKNVTEAALQKDPSIDAVFIVGDCCSAPVLQARASLGERADEITWATIDLGDPVLKALERDELSFALDQQPWLQGYLSVQTLALYKNYGFRPGGPLIATGPVVVDKENVAQVASLTKQGIR